LLCRSIQARIRIQKAISTFTKDRRASEIMTVRVLAKAKVRPQCMTVDSL